MRHHVFADSDTFSIAVLSKASAFNKQELLNNYVGPMVQQGIYAKEVVAFTLSYNESNKAPVKFIKEYLDTLLPAISSLGIKYLYVVDTNYFKVLTNTAKADLQYGYVLPCKVKGHEDLLVVLGVAYQSLIYNPSLQTKLDSSIKTLVSVIQGNYLEPGSSVIHSAQYPESLQDIANVLASLHKYTVLTVDIEAFSLRFNEAGIATIAFAWDKHNGVAFACDYLELASKSAEGLYGQNHVNTAVRALLKEFFETYKGELIFHNATYDIKVMVYVLWMKSLLDSKGCLTGLEILTRAFQDTKIIAYLATNSTAGNVLSLKALAHAFAGNWAQEEIKDVRRIALPELLQYNLIDALSTWYVKDLYSPIMVQDQQEELYRTLMLPSLKTIIQMELTGMPIDPQVLAKVKAELELEQVKQLRIITDSSLIQGVNAALQFAAMEAANAKLKTKQHPLEKFKDVQFNPNSGQQLQVLFYEKMGLPVLDYTDTKQPATGADTIEKLINHTDDAAHKAVLAALIDYGKVSKILSTFIPAFEAGVLKEDGMLYLHGGFNLGGTVSGRLSSSKPNMQNLPAGSKYGKAIKSCFVAPKGWIFAGADFNALEARIDALLTRDSNKLAVYIDGMDSHSFNTLTYWPDKMPDISKYLTETCLNEHHYRVEYSDGSVNYLPESLINEP